MKFDVNSMLGTLLAEYKNGIMSGEVPTIGSCKKRKKRNRKGQRFKSDYDEEEEEMDDELADLENEILLIMSLKGKHASSRNKVNSGRKRKRPKRKKLYFTCPETGRRSMMTYMHSVWFQSYVLNPQTECDQWNKSFRDRFRMPYSSFLDICNQCSEHELFRQWKKYSTFDARVRNGVPLELLVLAVLRYIGRGWTIDDLHENTVICYETIRRFINRFIKFGEDVLYKKYVSDPASSLILSECNEAFKMAGFPGCIGSTDATHIVVEFCPYRLRQLHLGYKVSHTARTYNLTCDHRRKILSTTSGHPARFNDKTLILFDDFIKDLKDGKYDEKFAFQLYDFDESDNVVEKSYNGCYVLVDNGYHNWSITIPPIATPSTRREIRFSEWVESVRKDVECCFGILKGRFRCLKYGVRLHGLEKCDQLWKTCCALHNMLLDVDGLCDGWEKGNKSHYETEIDDLNTLPFSLRRLLANNEVEENNGRDFDLSGLGMGNDVIRTQNEDIDDDSISELTQNNGKSVRKMKFYSFRSKLVNHFNIAFHKKKIAWPERSSKNKK